MTDNDIIKALECCIHEPMLNCRNCPYENSCNMGRSDIQRDVFAFINRLKTEIDILRSSLHVSSQNFENMARAMPNIAKATRIEAIKEFAEKLKEKVYIPGAYPNYSDEIIIEIDNLVKEMTEGDDES